MVEGCGDRVEDDAGGLMCIVLGDVLEFMGARRLDMLYTRQDTLGVGDCMWLMTLLYMMKSSKKVRGMDFYLILICQAVPRP